MTVLSRSVGLGGRVATIALGLTVGYLDALTLAAWMTNRRRERPRNQARCRFLVLVPAHDEERLVGSTLEALSTLDYPADHYAVHVVADNCADRTVEIVRSHGVEVHERIAPGEGGKGPALQWLLQRLWARGDPHDAVVIVDADTIVRPGFLSVAAAALADGAQVVQGYYAVRDADVSSTAAFRAAALAARHYLRPLGRTSLGGSCGLFGNGMVFAADVLRDRTWSRHLTEDNELQLDLLIDGTKVAFAPTAVVEAEMPHTLEAARSQNERWERGRLDLVRRYVPTLVRLTLTGGPAGRAAYVDAAADQLVPPFSVVVTSTALYGSAAALWLLVAPGPRPRRFAAVAALLAAGETVHVVAALRMVKAPAAVYRSLLTAPRHVAWKTGVWAKMLVRGDDVAWVRTVRNEPEAAASEV